MYCAILFATFLVSCTGGDVSSQPGGAPLERGHVMVHKEIQSKHLVQGQPFDVVYTVMNVGLECVPAAPPFAFQHTDSLPCCGVIFFYLIQLAPLFLVPPYLIPHPPNLF